MGRGVYRVAGDDPADHGERARHLLAGLRRPAVLSELSAAWALGVHEAGADDDVVVVAPRPAPRSRPGLLVRECRLERDEQVRTELGWATSPARTAVDLLRVLHPDVRALGAAEALAHRWSLTRDDVRAQRDRQAGARGAARAARLVERLDPLAESPRETALRLLVIDAGLPPPVPQHEVRDADGAFVARLDLAWPHRRVALEHDGAHHRDPRQHSLDLARHNRLRTLGWVVLQVDARVLAQPAEMLRHLARLLAGA
ncbi:hypothetical protein [uncultured Pseudokineococcus sp.]|uniref:hypothetical protein n=1 Tax=uncultured Pseudokineococcus sp. TaxID=1642928 RepID=UPI0026090A47|nr:hypothetical protein [uncultured Pseudokineococcus sp.]